MTGVAVASYLAAKGHFWLAFIVLLYEIPILFGIFLAAVMFINFKPPGW